MKNYLHSGYNNSFKIDYTIHKCPKILSEDIYLVFRNDLDDLYKSQSKEMYSDIYDYIKKKIYIIPTWQESVIPLDIIRLLLNFKNWLYFIRNKIKEKKLKDAWIDASCPHTGKCLLGRPTNNIYNELNGLSYLLDYKNEKQGCCGMVLHPKYQYRGYPITVFTNLSLEIIKELITEKKYLI